MRHQGLNPGAGERSSGSLVDRWANHAKLVRHVDQGFGMADQQGSAGFQQAREFADHSGSQRGVEINHRVPAQNAVETSFDSVRKITEVQAAKPDVFS